MVQSRNHRVIRPGKLPDLFLRTRGARGQTEVIVAPFRVAVIVFTGQPLVVYALPRRRLPEVRVDGDLGVPVEVNPFRAGVERDVRLAGRDPEEERRRVALPPFDELRCGREGLVVGEILQFFAFGESIPAGRAQVGFSPQRRVVACAGQKLRQRREPFLLHDAPLKFARIERYRAVLLREKPRHQACPACRADGRGDIGPLENHPLAAQPVEVRGFHRGIGVAHGPVAVVVAEHHDDVGAPSSSKALAPGGARHCQRRAAQTRCPQEIAPRDSLPGHGSALPSPPRTILTLSGGKITRFPGSAAFPCVPRAARKRAPAARIWYAIEGRGEGYCPRL